jgi:hypothetical protein
LGGHRNPVVEQAPQIFLKKPLANPVNMSYITIINRGRMARPAGREKLNIETAKNVTHIGVVPGALALGCCDLGRARLASGETVMITWGRNLTPEQAAWFAERTVFRPVRAPNDGPIELIIPENIAKQIALQG